MSKSDKTKEIYPVFQKFVRTGDKSLIKRFKLEELEQADLELGWRDKDSGYRAAIKNRIDELEKRWSTIKKIALGLFIAVFAGIIVMLFDHYYL